MEGERRRRVACVTGAGGFLGSWLVKLLLSRGYIVHGTVRNPSDEKNAHLLNLEGTPKKLRLFEADILDYEAVRRAIEGCEGVFHVASPVLFKDVLNPELELITPAVTGTLNVLKASLAEGVKRVVVVSSGAAVILNPNWPEDKLMDEDCWTDKEHCRNVKNWYFLAKTMAEEEATHYAKNHGLDVITVCPTFILGPLLQPTVNATSLFFIGSILKGCNDSMENKYRHFIDVRDVADALHLVYEKTEACGRYICAAHRMKISDLVEMLKKMYPEYKYPTNFIESNDKNLVSSEKLTRLGWRCRTLEETLVDSVEYYRKAGLLNSDS